jgi:hypothetical protein
MFMAVRGVPVVGMEVLVRPALDFQIRMLVRAGMNMFVNMRMAVRRRMVVAMFAHCLAPSPD